MKKKQSKTKIIVTAFELFVTEGYRVGINRIIDKAGVSRGALYHYFNSKEDLFEEVVKTYFFKQFQELPDIVSGPGNFQSKIQKIMYLPLSPLYEVDQCGNYQHTGAEGYLTIVSAIHQNKRLLQLQDDYNKLWVESLKTVVQQGIKEGQLTPRQTIAGLVDAIRLIVDGALLNAYNTSLEEAKHKLQRSVSYLLSINFKPEVAVMKQ
ncbi:MAG: TetR/AcrR family transcriptional regulator [Sphaerochaeta sp.]|jgi:AcrR family transcriptional regulator|uniref:TetR/AcrR family transcriptional regulator n=1 Tax=Sphaerochaeta halotolerans TaxID=2293840 RepID=A0A372MJ90_9SPIR|nr:TetR/AcrR family transcriptional regulator [Sphaerochaeta halotolerans]MBG0766657.1 TetR/AcrR family transcriptional regulator [Spirochaetaceae bacterium]RFU95240.1 TetR/AcrR family transcriptional regulator [Sphaerochaeta halotolerans]